jgi:hypothetical protein
MVAVLTDDTADQFRIPADERARGLARVAELRARVAAIPPPQPVPAAPPAD